MNENERRQRGILFGNIIVEGNIGAGKSTFTEALARHLPNAEAVFEPADGENPFMPLYYDDPARWSFAMQVFLLSKRYRAHLYAQQKALFSRDGFVILDRSYFGDACFARVQRRMGFFNTHEYRAYFNLHKDMATHILYPTCVIHLQTLPETCLKRISKRMTEKEGRKCESSIDPAYLAALSYEIDATVNELKKRGCRVISVDYNKDLSEAEIESLVESIARRIEAIAASPEHEAWTGLDAGWPECNADDLKKLAAYTANS